MSDRNKLKDLIPWYLNGTLTGEELRRVEDYCNNNPEGRAALEELMKLKQYLQNRDEIPPSAVVESRLFDQIRSRSIEQIGILHPYALGLSLVILVMLWTIIRPGVVLNWNRSTADATSFRIYRSELGEGQYQMLDEIPANIDTVNYTYIDQFFWPFTDYEYYIEGMNLHESLGASPILVSHPIMALPGQLAITCASFCMGYGLLLFIRFRRIFLIGSSRLIAA